MNFNFVVAARSCVSRGYSSGIGGKFFIIPNKNIIATAR